MMQTMPQCTGEWSPFAGRRPALGHGVPGRGPARRYPFGIVCILVIERMLLELRLGGGLKVLPELEPARVELANGGPVGVETTEHLQDRQGGLHVGTYLLVPRNQ